MDVPSAARPGASATRRAWLWTIRSDCERAFAFLVEDYGYRRARRRFRNGGFELAYRGPAAGVIVNWFPRDTLMVWLVRLVDGEFPPRKFDYLRTDAGLHYSDLRDLKAISDWRREEVDEWRLYSPDAEVVQNTADSLRRCGADFLRGDFAQVPLLEERVWARVRELDGQ